MGTKIIIILFFLIPISIFGQSFLPQSEYVFNTVAEMKQNTGLPVNANVKTLGYYAKNDGGGAIYKITAGTIGGEGVNHTILAASTYANFVWNGTIILEQAGLKGDGVTDNRNALTQLRLYLHGTSGGKTVFGISNSNYYVSASNSSAMWLVSSNTHIDLKGAKISSSSVSFSAECFEIYGTADSNIVIENFYFYSPTTDTVNRPENSQAITSNITLFDIANVGSKNIELKNFTSDGAYQIKMKGSKVSIHDFKMIDALNAFFINDCTDCSVYGGIIDRSMVIDPTDARRDHHFYVNGGTNLRFENLTLKGWSGNSFSIRDAVNNIQLDNITMDSTQEIYAGGDNMIFNNLVFYHPAANQLIKGVSAGGNLIVDGLLVVHLDTAEIETIFEAISSMNTVKFSNISTTGELAFFTDYVNDFSIENSTFTNWMSDNPVGKDFLVRSNLAQNNSTDVTVIRNCVFRENQTHSANSNILAIGKGVGILENCIVTNTSVTEQGPYVFNSGIGNVLARNVVTVKSSDLLYDKSITRSTTGTFAITDESYIRVDATTGAQTYTLPTPTKDKEIKIKRIDANPATVITLTGTVDAVLNPTSTGGGSPIATLAAQYGSMTLIGNGASWDVF
jgi:hypothetical protein